MQKITPFLWFDNNAEEALNLYTSLFKNSRIANVSRVGGGKLMTATFYLDNQEFMALNGGPMFKFTEAISLFVKCDTQEEIDYFWERLSEGGEKSRCGWLKDKFGVSWQIIPTVLGELMNSKDVEKGQKVMQAMLAMSKLDIEALKAAAR